jgi:tripartite-type tricarboxylate transporter receptor subunit TctC
MKTLLKVAAVVTAGLILVPGIARAADFAGKQIAFVVPFKEGSSTDRYARMFSIFLKKYLPGHPTIVLNHRPGGSGVKAANWFDTNASVKPDGLTVLAVSTSNHTSFIFGGKKIKYDELGWRPIVLSPSGTCFYARTETGVTGKDPAADIEKLRKGKWVVSGKNPTSSEIRTFLALDLLGIKNITPVFGLSTGGRRKAVARGEVHLGNDAAGGCLKQTARLEKQGVLKVFMTLGFVKPDGSIVRDPAFPDKYTVLDAYRAVYGKDPSGPAWRMLKHLINIAVMTSKSLVLPKGTSDDVVNTYIAAVKKSLKDPEFRKATKDQFEQYPQSFGSDAANIYKEAVGIDPKVKAWMQDWLSKRFNVNL